MLKILDKNRTHVGTITDYQDLKIEEDVSTGLSSISFYYLGTETIPNEYYVETEEARYTVKEREPDENGSSYQAKLDLEELQRDVFTRFTAKEKTIREAAELALNGTGWTVSTTITTKRNVQRFKVNRLEVLEAICAAWMCEIEFDNLNRVITLKPQIGEDRGVYFIKGLNLRKSGLVSDSYDYVTRLIPYGEDGLTIESVNDGLAYIDNFQYSNKIITQIWEDTNYTDAAALKEDAVKKLADMSKPKLSYTADVIDLAEASPDYDIMAFGIGDTIRLYDETTGITDMQRIVKLTRYPDNPAKNSCEIANTTLTFEELQDRNEKAAAAWEDVSNTDGTVNGVYVHGISQENEVIIETIIGDSPTIEGIKEDALSSVQVQFAQGDSATVAPETGWSSQAPAWDSGKFVWQKTTQVHLDGHTETPVATNISGAKGDTGATGPKGDTGTSVTRVRTMYYLSTSNTTQTGGSWDYTPAQYVAGRYYWKKTMTFLSDGTTQEGAPVLDNALTDANSNAYSAVTSANGKNVNIYQANTPGSTGRVVGDTWFKTQTTSGTTTIVGLYKWDGTEWVQQPLNATVIPLLDAGKIVTGILQAIRIQSADGNSYWNLAQNEFVTKNGDFQGKVTSTEGSIGGWDISTDGIRKTSGNTSVGLLSGTNAGTFLYISDSSSGDTIYPFAAYRNGNIDWNYLYDNKIKKLRASLGTLYGYYDGTQYGILDLTAQYGGYTDTALTGKNGVRLEYSNSAKGILVLYRPETGNVEQVAAIDRAGVHLDINKGVYAYDPYGNEFPMIRQGSSNLWIGAEKINGSQHNGKTYISAGYDGSILTPNDTIYVCVPNADNSAGTAYGVYHTGKKPTKSDVGLGNVTNYDQSKAIKGITRSGATFTFTRIDGTTGTFTQKEYDETSSATFTATLGSATDSITVRKKGVDVYFWVALYLSGGGKPFTNVSSGDTIGTLPEGFRPPMTWYADALLSSSGTWASASTYPCMLRINSNGKIDIVGNEQIIHDAGILRAFVHYVAA